MDKKPVEPKRDPKEDEKLRNRMQSQMRLSIGFLITALIGLWLFQQFILTPLTTQATEIPYSEFKQKVHDGQLTTVLIGDTRITGEMKAPDGGEKAVPFTTVAVPNGDPKLIEELGAAQIKYSVRQPPSPLGDFVVAWLLPMLLLGGVWWFAYRRMSGGMAGGRGGIFGVGKSRATEVKPEDVQSPTRTSAAPTRRSPSCRRSSSS